MRVWDMRREVRASAANRVRIWNFRRLRGLVSQLSYTSNGGEMPITVRELAHRTASVLRQVEVERRKILVTSNGRPVAVLVPIDAEDLLDRALATLIPSEQEIAREIMEGQTKTLAEVMAELKL